MDLSSAHFMSVFNTATEQNTTIVHLHAFVIVVCVLIGIVVAALLGTAAFRFRYKGDNTIPYQNHGNTKLEIIWTVVPAFICLVLAILTAVVMETIHPPQRNPQADVVVIGHQFWWEYRYPKLGVVTANELYLPLGVNSQFEIRAADVNHSFWVPGFGEKMDAIPGHPNYVFFKPVQQGLFLGTCAEYCGAEHGLMRILATVLQPKDFNAWIQTQKKVPSAPTDSTAQQGQQLFNTHTCVQCHAIAGTAATAQVGPDLTHIGDRKTIGAGVLSNSVDNLTQWIMNAQKFKPGCYMPKMRLHESDAHAIAVYLESLK